MHSPHDSITLKEIQTMPTAKQEQLNDFIRQMPIMVRKREQVNNERERNELQNSPRQ